MPEENEQRDAEQWGMVMEASKVTFQQELREAATWASGGGIFQAEGGAVQRLWGEQVLGMFEEAEAQVTGRNEEEAEWWASLAMEIVGFDR